MKEASISILSLLLFITSFAQGKDIYVSKSGTSGYPYGNWATAATNIEWAVNAGAGNDMVWISNGVYILTNQIRKHPVHWQAA
jgi:hypothetical protein